MTKPTDESPAQSPADPKKLQRFPCFNPAILDRPARPFEPDPVRAILTRALAENDVEWIDLCQVALGEVDAHPTSKRVELQSQKAAQIVAMEVVANLRSALARAARELASRSAEEESSAFTSLEIRPAHDQTTTIAGVTLTGLDGPENGRSTIMVRVYGEDRTGALVKLGQTLCAALEEVRARLAAEER
jgi:hypothetical protein